MITLKEYLEKISKEEFRKFYLKIVAKPKEKITKLEMYQEITKLYQDDPEVILKMVSPEEVNILKNLLENNYPKKENGYIEFVLINNLLNNYLIFANKKEYYIPKDLINYIKMALNLYDEEAYYLKDVADCTILGIMRLCNVLKLSDLITILNKYNIVFQDNKIKEYLKNNPRLNDKIKILKYQKEEYIVSLEFFFYKEILRILENKYSYPELTLEELISLGKYRINLFLEPIFKFLSFIERHLEAKYVDLVMTELIIYTGFDLNDLDVLNRIADFIPELFNELKKVETHFPVWIYKGNSVADLKK